LKEGGEKTYEVAEKNMNEVKKLMGMYVKH
jgi:hypothetical protein